MDKYKIRIYSSAKQDLKDIIAYINTLSPQATITQYDSIVEKIRSLEQMPLRCPQLKDTQLRLRGFKQPILKD